VRRCFATARELGLEQGEQHRLLRLAATHSAETQDRERSRSAAAAVAGASAAPRLNAGGAEAASPQAPLTTAEDQQPVAAQGEPTPESMMSGLTPASADSRAAADGGGVGLPGDADLAEDGPARQATAPNPAADRPQVQTPSTEQPDRTGTSVTSAARTAAGDRQAGFMRAVCRRLQAELPVTSSRQCNFDV